MSENTVEVIEPKAMVPLIKRTLLGNFTVRFSVKSNWRSISVTWVGGPSEAEVRRVVRQFDGATFDSATDTWYQRPSEFDGRHVQWGANYISCERLNQLGRR